MAIGKIQKETFLRFCVVKGRVFSSQHDTRIHVTQSPISLFFFHFNLKIPSVIFLVLWKKNPKIRVSPLHFSDGSKFVRIFSDIFDIPKSEKLRFTTIIQNLRISNWKKDHPDYWYWCKVNVVLLIRMHELKSFPRTITVDWFLKDMG